MLRDFAASHIMPQSNVIIINQPECHGQRVVSHPRAALRRRIVADKLCSKYETPTKTLLSSDELEVDPNGGNIIDEPYLVTQMPERCAWGLNVMSPPRQEAKEPCEVEVVVEDVKAWYPRGKSL